MCCDGAQERVRAVLEQETDCAPRAVLRSNVQGRDEVDIGVVDVATLRVLLQE